MRALKGFFLTLSVLAVLGGAAFGVLAWHRSVEARSLDNIIVEPAPPQPQAPAPAEEIDPRLEGLKVRPDGARLLWAPSSDEGLLAAGFADNGTLIVSATTTDGKGERWDILSLDLATRDPKTLFDGADARIASSGRSAHRNADRLCYGKRGERGVFDVWCSDLDGADEKRVTEHDGREDLVSPAISPDGAWVAFDVENGKDAVSGKPIGGTIWKIGLNGAGIQQLTRSGDDRSPSWSADGRSISFQRRMPDGNWDMYVMDADGKNPAPILRTLDVDELSPMPRGGSDEYVIVESASGTPSRIKAVDAITKSGRYLTSDAVAGTSLSVSPDGKLVCFIAPVSEDRPNDLGVWLVQAGD